SSSALMVVVSSDALTVGEPAFRATLDRVQGVLAADEAISSVTPPDPQAGTVSRDGRVAIVMGGAAESPTGMVAAADRLKGDLDDAAGAGMAVDVTGASGLWSDFNAANTSAMVRSELMSWPVTLAILVLAFGALVAAGLPLLLTIMSLAASAGTLVLLSGLFDISIWAMNFALMFALALGIDYALFIVVRFRAALFGAKMSPAEAAGVTMDTAGKAVAFSGVTVLIALSAVMLVPSPAFRSMALGIMLSVVFVLVAALTLLPAVLAKLGPRVNRLSLSWVRQGEHRSPRFQAWGERLWAHPLRYGVPALLLLLVLAAPIAGLKTGMPSIKVVPESAQAREGYNLVSGAFGPGAPGQLQIVGPADQMETARAVAAAEPGIAMATPPRPGGSDLALVQAVPTVDPSDPALGATIDRLREAMPAGVLIGGSSAENHDLESALGEFTPIVIAVVLGLGFLLMLFAFRAPLAAAIGVLTSLLATAAAFGIARLIFQEGWLSGILGFESQGFLNAWGPVFFFAMIFAISMDYTVFLMSSIKEHWEGSGDAREAVVGGMAHTGRVIIAAAAVMVAVFFTFAISGPLPPKEMGIILGVAVLLDAVLVRLLLMPVLLRLAGPAAWWTPRWVARVLPEVRFSH
ncbi:MAG: MMPL family transporter, partial [Miltoncostaeaceae bacterium]